MEIDYTEEAQEDLLFWKKSGNKIIQKKIQELLTDIQLHPEIGIGKPEQLKHKLTGCWSRRINQEHRIIYKFSNRITILSLRGHY